MNSTANNSKLSKSWSWWMPCLVTVMRLWLRFRKVGIVLFGHGLTDGETDELIASRHDDFGTFASAIKLYEDWGFEFISMEELLDIANGDFKFEKNWVHLTFDDGYESPPETRNGACAGTGISLWS